VVEAYLGERYARQRAAEQSRRVPEGDANATQPSAPDDTAKDSQL
jgi:hypothetical protein